MSVTQNVMSTKIPARMDRLPWARWHWLVVLSLGTVWILDGLEVTIKGAVGPSLRESLGFTTFSVAATASMYLVGAVCGALFWGYLTDRYGRQKLLMFTLGTYMVGVLGTTLAGLWLTENFAYIWFGVFRFITGFGIGGEYAAINSAIDELIPARVRGWVDLVINGSWWIGTAIAAALGALFLSVFPTDVAWRVAFGMGGVLAIGILLMRLYVPESPRWLMTHGYVEEAERTVRGIEQKVKEQTGEDELPEPPDDAAIEIRERRSIGFIELGRNAFKVYPDRSIAGFSILVTQAFLYNAIFFTYGLMLTTFFGVANANVGWYLIPFAVGNYMGPLILGRFFDTRGRKTMIPLCFWTAGGLTILFGFMFAADILFTAAWIMTLGWVLIFFFASAGASAGYLTVSETFPLEIRAMAISLFYASATFIGGVFGPLLYGALIAGGSEWNIFWGYLIGGTLMITGGIMHRIFGVEAAQMELEEVTKPLSAAEADEDEDGAPSFEGPEGFDPTDAEAVRAFQKEHGLEADGVIGAQTAGALRALRESGRADGDGRGITLVDITDSDAVRDFQRRYGLTDDGVVGPETMGALRAAERRVLVDPADEEAVKRFQRAHGLAEDGVVGPDTQAALRAVRTARSDDAAEETFITHIDVLDPEKVKRFQRAVGLEQTGNFDARSRGALKLEKGRRDRLGLDPTDEDSIKAFQREHDLKADGVIGPVTRAVLRRLREREERLAAGPRQPALFGVDPMNVESVRRFQAQHDLKPDGCIGAETRAVLRRRSHLLSGVDITDATAVEDFQREHGLRPDGVVGPKTQGAIRALRAQTEPTGIAEEGDEQRAERDEDEAHKDILDFDPADADAVREFQRAHGLEPDGVIGDRTRAALRAVLQERAIAAQQEEPARPERRLYRDAMRRMPSYGAGFRTYSAPAGEDWEFEQELRQILRELPDDQPLSRRELRERVNGGRWGPGRFNYVLSAATEEGILRRIGRDRYARA